MNDFSMWKDSILVYMDSADYSNLSKFSNRAGEHQSIAQSLDSLRSHPRIKFTYSWAHVSEMTALSSKYDPDSYARISEMSRYCGKNACLSLDKLFRGEIRFLTSGHLPPLFPFSESGDWFPDSAKFDSPIEELDVLKEYVQNQFQDTGLSRNERRLRKKKYPHNELGVARILDDMVAQTGYKSFKKFCSERYPVTDALYSSLMSYFIGRSDWDDVSNAMMEIFREPPQLYRWIQTENEARKTMSDWLRRPAKALVDLLTPDIEILNDTYLKAHSKGEANLLPISLAQWDEMANKTVLNVVERLLRDEGDDRKFDIKAIEKHCRGIAVSIRIAYSVMRMSVVNKTPREFISNDVADCIHAAYSPYMDVFRPDSKIADHCARVVKNYGTKVVPHLRGLPSAIENRL